MQRRVTSMCSANMRSDWRAQKYFLELVKFLSSKRMPSLDSPSNVIELCTNQLAEHLVQKLDLMHMYRKCGLFVE